MIHPFEQFEIRRAVQSDYTIEVIASEIGLEQIAPEWLQLWRDANNATPFQSPHWNIAWWHHLRHTGRPDIVTLREQGRLIALAPWMLFTDPDTHRRVLTFFAGGVSDYHDILWHPSISTAQIRSFVRCMLRHVDWDDCELGELRPDSPVIGAAAEGHDVKPDIYSLCPVLRLSAGTPLDCSLRSSAARTLGYYRRRVARGRRVHIRAADDHNLDYMLRELFRLHSEVWLSRGQSGVLSNPELAAFHREVSFEFLREGMLRLYLLSIDDISAAAFYGFRCHERTYYYLGGFAPAFAQLNPGTLVVGHAIEQAMHEGCTEFDFLRGNESYKHWWGAQDRPSYRVHIARNPTYPEPVHPDDSSPGPRSNA